MKFKHTRLMAAAAIAITLSSQATAAPVTTVAGDITYANGVPLRLDPGSSQAAIAYSSGANFDGHDPYTVDGAVGAMNLGRIKVGDIDGLGVEEPSVVDVYQNYDEPIRIGITTRLSIHDHTIDDVTGQILSVSTAGGIEHRATRYVGTLTGGAATLSNLRFDLVNKHVYADLTGTKAAIGSRPPINYNLPDTLLWTMGAISGPTHIDPGLLALSGQARTDALVAAGFTDEGNGSFSAQTTASNLQITQTGLDFFNHSLGLLAISRLVFAEINNDPYG